MGIPQAIVFGGEVGRRPNVQPGAHKRKGFAAGRVCPGGTPALHLLDPGTDIYEIACDNFHSPRLRPMLLTTVAQTF
jgi:hypothetical protein